MNNPIAKKLLSSITEFTLQQMIKERENRSYDIRSINVDDPEPFTDSDNGPYIQTYIMIKFTDDEDYSCEYELNIFETEDGKFDCNNDGWSFVHNTDCVDELVDIDVDSFIPSFHNQLIRTLLRCN